MNKSYLSLQNGSDIRGTALDILGAPVTFSAIAAADVALSFAFFLSKRLSKPLNELKIAIGRDSRLSGPLLLESAAKALSGHGVTVLDCGLASTPAMFMSLILQEHMYDGSIMITASHLPKDRNGMKFFIPSGGLEKNDITEILKGAESVLLSASENGKVTQKDLMKDYSAHLVSLIRAGISSPDSFLKPLSGLKICVDAGNGAGGFFASDVLSPLGADISGSQFLNPDGSFPNHAPNPEDAEAMASLKSALSENGCDFGILFDTDVDRAGAALPSGEVLSRNRLIALLSSIVLKEHPGATIVTDSVTSDELTAFIEQKLSGKHHRFKRGYKNVINEAIRLNKDGISCPLAIETSGHGAFKENFFLDDGAYIIAKLLIEIGRLKKDGKSLSSLLDGFEEPADSKEFRLKILSSDFKKYGEDILLSFENFVKENPSFKLPKENYEGVRASFFSEKTNGFCLLRLSLHDPLLPFNLETREAGGTRELLKSLMPFFEKAPELDISPLMDYLK